MFQILATGQYTLWKWIGQCDEFHELWTFNFFFEKDKLIEDESMRWYIEENKLLPHQ